MSSTTKHTITKAGAIVALKKKEEVKTPQTSDKITAKDEPSADQIEPIPEEVKKVPRYFPPKKLPNPFESAA